MSKHYPLMDAADSLKAASGRPFVEITPDTLDELEIADLQIHADALRAQAEIACEAGYTQLAANLTRAAELTAVPNAELLRMYELLRPGRSTYAELVTLADALQTRYNALENARLVLEAAEVYRARGLVGKDEEGRKQNAESPRRQNQS